ncbi:MAG TPA: hypothetical protein VGD08_24030 [Stellaceae bacterium]
MIEYPTSEDKEVRTATLEYVVALYRDLTAENGAPLPGTQNQVADMILADPDLCEYVRRWAAGIDFERAPAPRPPIDDVYRRLRARMTEAMRAETPVLGTGNQPQPVEPVSSPGDRRGG